MIFSGSGRCHGPDCQAAALIEDGFCSESCQVRWNGQFTTRTRFMTFRVCECGRPIYAREPHPTQAGICGCDICAGGI